MKKKKMYKTFSLIGIPLVIALAIIGLNNQTTIFFNIIFLLDCLVLGYSLGRWHKLKQIEDLKE